MRVSGVLVGHPSAGCKSGRGQSQAVWIGVCSIAPIIQRLGDGRPAARGRENMKALREFEEEKATGRASFEIEG
jgi:hypothetical protein